MEVIYAYELVHLAENTLLGFFHIFLSTSDLRDEAQSEYCMRIVLQSTNLDVGFASYRLLFLSALLFFRLLVGEVQVYTESVAKLVNTGATAAYNPADEVSGNVELSGL